MIVKKTMLMLIILVYHSNNNLSLHKYMGDASSLVTSAFSLLSFEDMAGFFSLKLISYDNSDMLTIATVL